MHNTPAGQINKELEDGQCSASKSQIGCKGSAMQTNSQENLKMLLQQS